MTEEWWQKLEKAALVNKLKKLQTETPNAPMYEPKPVKAQAAAKHTQTVFEDEGCRCDEEGSLWKRLLG